MINSFKLPLKYSINLLFFLLLSILFLSCSKTKNMIDHLDHTDPLDRQAGLTRADVKKAMIADKTKKIDGSEIPKMAAPLPRTSRMLSIPLPPSIGGEKLISFSATEQVP